MRISIYQTGSKWKVYRKGLQKAVKVCRNRGEAIQFGSKLAFDTRSELVVHERDGRVDFVIDYLEY